MQGSENIKRQIERQKKEPTLKIIVTGSVFPLHALQKVVESCIFVLEPSLFDFFTPTIIA